MVVNADFSVWDSGQAPWRASDTQVCLFACSRKVFLNPQKLEGGLVWTAACFSVRVICLD